MKKYIEPSIDVENIIDEELIIATSGNVDQKGVFNKKGDEDEFSKRIDFSEEESIW